MTVLLAREKIALEFLSAIGNLDRALQSGVFWQQADHLADLCLLVQPVKLVGSANRVKIFVTVLALMQIVLRMQVVIL